MQRKKIERHSVSKLFCYLFIQGQLLEGFHVLKITWGFQFLITTAHSV